MAVDVERFLRSVQRWRCQQWSWKCRCLQALHEQLSRSKLASVEGSFLCCRCHIRKGRRAARDSSGLSSNATQARTYAATKMTSKARMFKLHMMQSGTSEPCQICSADRRPRAASWSGPFPAEDMLGTLTVAQSPLPELGAGSAFLQGLQNSHVQCHGGDSATTRILPQDGCTSSRVKA